MSFLFIIPNKDSKISNPIISSLKDYGFDTILIPEYISSKDPSEILKEFVPKKTLLCLNLSTKKYFTDNSVFFNLKNIKENVATFILNKDSSKIYKYSVKDKSINNDFIRALLCNSSLNFIVDHSNSTYIFKVDTLNNSFMPHALVLNNYNKQHTIRIKPDCFWTDSLTLANNWSRFGYIKDKLITYPFKNHTIILDPYEEHPSYNVIVGATNNPFDINKGIHLYMEPHMENNPQFSYFCKDLDGKCLVSVKHNYFQNMVDWHISKTIHELLNETIHKKYDKVLSIIVSRKYIDEGHKLRINFIRELEKRQLSFDLHIYGDCESFKFKNYKGKLPPYNKEDGLFPYKYHFNAENHSINNYVTEKFTDAILSETFIFYWGCPNLEKIYDRNCFQRLSLKPEKYNEEIKLIEIMIKNNEWKNRLESIRKMKDVILKKRSFFPRINNIIQLSESTLLVNNTNSLYKNILRKAENVRVNNLVELLQTFSRYLGGETDIIVINNDKDPEEFIRAFLDKEDGYDLVFFSGGNNLLKDDYWINCRSMEKICFRAQLSINNKTNNVDNNMLYKDISVKII